MKKYLAHVFAAFILMTFFVLPLVTVHAQETQTTGGMSGLVYKCKGEIKNPDGTTAQGEVPCDSFAEFISAIQAILNTAIKYALLFSVFIILYVGYLYLTSGGEAGKRKKANDTLVSVAIGIFWTLGAWLVVNLVLNTLASDKIPRFLK